MNVFLVALGANLPLGEQTPINTLRSALDLLPERGIKVESVSKFYQTPCFPAGSGPDYVNAAAKLRSELTPQEMLHCIHEIEKDHGRERAVRWGMRTLDLDLIAAEDQIIPDRATFDKWLTLPPDAQKNVPPDQLILPHPRIQDRAFVLVPLCDVAADWTHPVLNRTASELRDALPKETLGEIVPL